MAKYTNFYETIKEANMRLAHTVVLYDGDPYYVLTCTDHKTDGIFRIYLDKVGQPGGLAMSRLPGIPYEYHEDLSYPEGIANLSNVVFHKKRGELMDKFLDDNPDCGIIRKMMNSPAFNKFRPFEIGMLNTKFGAVYAQRSPTRHTQQGLTSSMIVSQRVELDPPADNSRSRQPSIELTSTTFLECIKGVYPSLDECIKELRLKECNVKSAAFHRNFAVVKGPVNSLFLAYKEDVIGIIPRGPESVIIGSDYTHCKEVVTALGAFESVVA